MSKIKKILQFAMRMERDAQNFYSYYATISKNDSIKNLFDELAKVEENHHDILKSKFDNLGFTTPPQVISWVVDNTERTVDPGIISTNLSIVDDPDVPISELSIIRMAYFMENDFVLFYEKAMGSVDSPEEKEFLSKMADWEKGHRNMFYSKYQRLLEKYWGDISSIIFEK